MVMHKKPDFSVHYYPDMIVISGSTRVIHIEAYKILRRFQCSAKPYQVTEDADDHIVLTLAKH